MNQFTLEATLDTKEPFTIDFLGQTSAVTHKVTGTLQLQVLKSVHLKQISVTFLGQIYSTFGKAPLTVKSEPINTDKIEQILIDTPTLYLPGDYSFPFQLWLPGDIATTDCSKLKIGNLFWEYFLVLSATPVGLIARRKEYKQRLALRRVHIEPSSSSIMRFFAKRNNQLDCTISGPKFVSFDQDVAFLGIHLHPYAHAYRVKEIHVFAYQNECIVLESHSHLPENRGQRSTAASDDKYMCQGRRVQRAIANSYETKPVSNMVVIPNPDQEDCATGWGRETPIEVVLEWMNADMLPSEFLTWLKIGHGLHFTIVFADETIKPMIIKAPVIVGKILEDPWTHLALRAAAHEVGEADGTALPEYGEEVELSTLLDSNTARVENMDLYRELYPEREELVVPDVGDDMPPTYERDVVQPEPYSEKL